jgi:hypothetical protein
VSCELWGLGWATGWGGALSYLACFIDFIDYGTFRKTLVTPRHWILHNTGGNSDVRRKTDLGSAGVLVNAGADLPVVGWWSRVGRTIWGGDYDYDYDYDYDLVDRASREVRLECLGSRRAILLAAAWDSYTHMTSCRYR